MPLSDVVQRAADNLTRAAERLERGMAQVGTAGGRLGQAAAAGMPAWSARFNAAEAARAAQWPAIHAQRAAEQAARRGGGLGAGLASGAAEALVGHALRGMNPVPAATPGIPVVAHGGPGAAQEALAAQYRAAQAGTALAVLARETMQAAAAAAVFTMTLRRAAGLAPVPPGGGGGVPRLPGPGGAVGFPGGPLAPYGGPRVRVVGATWNQAGAGGGAGIPWATAAGGGGLAGAASSLGAAFVAVAGSAAAVVGAFHTIVGLVGKALPSATATLSGSFDILQAKIGRDFIPVIDAASTAVQAASRAYDMIPRVLRENTLTFGLDNVLRQLGVGPQARSMQTGLRAGIVSGEAYDQALQEAGISRDELQTQLMRDQLAALQEWLGTARSIQADVAALRGQGPSFR